MRGHPDICVCACVCVCVNLACLLYNKHWSKTGPSCQAAAVTTNNDYPLPAPQSLLHNHQRRGDPPLLGEQCNPWVGLIIAQAHSYQPSEGPPDPISLSLCVCLCVCWYLVIFCVFCQIFSNEHHRPDILSPDPEWFKPFWCWQIMYQSIHMVRIFL